MPPCHTTPFLSPGVLVAPPADKATAAETPAARGETCDYCGGARLEWRKCKLICTDCRQINKSCADL